VALLGFWHLLQKNVFLIIDNSSAAELGYSLNNTYRLLETYRSNTFFGSHEPAGQYDRGSSELLPLVPSVEQHVAEVCGALEQALVAVFGSDKKDEAIDRIEGVLRSVAYPSKFGASSEADTKIVATFFDQLLERLQIK
jgi:hypothetical protein